MQQAPRVEAVGELHRVQPWFINFIKKYSVSIWIKSSSFKTYFFLHSLVRVTIPARRSSENSAATQFPYSFLHYSIFPKISSEYLFFLLLRSKNFTLLFISDGYPEFIVNPPPSTNNNTWRHSTPLTILQLHAASSQGGDCWRSS